MNVQGIARAAALARSQDSRILKISAASASIHRRLSGPIDVLAGQRPDRRC